MKLDKVLTVTALATGITLGAFVDSAEARGSGRYSRKSALPDFSFGLIEQAEEPDNDDSSGLFLGAVDNLIYFGQGTFPSTFFPSQNSSEPNEFFHFSFNGDLKAELSGNTVEYTVTPNSPFSVFNDANFEEVNLITQLSDVKPLYNVYTFAFDFSNAINNSIINQSEIKDNYVNSLAWLGDNNLPSQLTLPELIISENITLIDKSGNQYNNLTLPDFIFEDDLDGADEGCLSSGGTLTNGFCVIRQEIPDPKTTPESSTTLGLLTLGLVSFSILKKKQHKY